LDERLSLLNGIAFLNEYCSDDSAFERLHDLHLARRDNTAGAAFDLIEYGVMCPDAAAHEHCYCRKQKQARRSRRF
jgi:hypothetical protein